MMKCELCSRPVEVILRANDPEWHTRPNGIYLLCNHHYNEYGGGDVWPIKISDDDFLVTLAMLEL